MSSTEKSATEKVKILQRQVKDLTKERNQMQHTNLTLGRRIDDLQNICHAQSVTVSQLTKKMREAKTLLSVGKIDGYGREKK